MSSTFPANATPLDINAERERVKASPPPAKRPRSGPAADRLFGLAAKGAALLTLAMLIGILLSLLAGAWPAISKFGLGFLTSSVWDPVQNEFGGLVRPVFEGSLEAEKLLELVHNQQQPVPLRPIEPSRQPSGIPRRPRQRHQGGLPCGEGEPGRISVQPPPHRRRVGPRQQRHQQR